MAIDYKLILMHITGNFNSEITLKQIAQTNQPVILSMGMGGNKKNLQSIFKNNKNIFCYCIAEYPLEFNKIKTFSMKHSH